jgi:hypothetical protein
MSRNALPPDCLSVKAAGRLLGMSSHVTLKEVALGNIKAAVRPGYPVMIERASVEKRVKELAQLVGSK